MSPSSTVTVKLLFLTVPTAFLLCGALNAKETVYDCNFDKDNCGWIFSSDNSLFKWERRSKGDPTKGHGPVRDVTGTGYFMNLRVSQEKSPTNVTVKSPVMKSTVSSTSCQLRFSYSPYKSIPVHCQNSKGDKACEKKYGSFKKYVCNPNSGDKMMLDAIMKECAQFCGFKCPQLEVMVRAGGVSEKMKLSSPIVFSETWNAVDVDIPQKYTGNDMTITVEAVTGWDVDSYIALDNISFTGCKFPTLSATGKAAKVTTQAATQPSRPPSTKISVPIGTLPKTKTSQQTTDAATTSVTKLATTTAPKQPPVTTTETSMTPTTTATNPTVASTTGAANSIVSSLSAKTNRPITSSKPAASSPPAQSVPSQSASANPTTRQGTTTEITSTVPAKPTTVTAARSLEKTTSSAMGLVITTIYAPVLAVISYVVMSI